MVRNGRCVKLGIADLYNCIVSISLMKWDIYPESAPFASHVNTQAFVINILARKCTARSYLGSFATLCGVTVSKTRLFAYLVKVPGAFGTHEKLRSWMYAIYCIIGSSRRTICMKYPSHCEFGFGPIHGPACSNYCIFDIPASLDN